MASIKYFILQHLFPHFYARVAENRLKRKNDSFLKKEVNIDLTNCQDTATLIKTLFEYNVKERDRKNTIDEKAKASLFIVTLAITIVLASLNFIKDKTSILDLGGIPLIMLIMGVVYLLLSGITSIAALNIREFYGVGLVEVIKENDGRYSFENTDEVKIINKLFKYINLNQMITNISANYIYATFIGIRNGIILIAAFFIAIVGKVGIDNLASIKYIQQFSATMSNLLGAGLLERTIDSSSYLLIVLGSIGMILFITKFPVSTRIKDLELTPTKIFSLNGYQVWKLSWLLIILGSLFQLLAIWVF